MNPFQDEKKPPTDEEDNTVGIIIIVVVVLLIVASYMDPGGNKSSNNLASSNNTTTNSSASHIKGRAIAITSTVFGKRYVDIRVNCKNTICSRERFYFTKDKEEVLYYALRNDSEILVSYDDNFFFSSIKEVEIN